MKKTTTHSRSGLFLMELILSLLILSLAAAACIQIFAAARSFRRQAREWNHIQELTISAGEILEGTDGSTEAFLHLLPDGTAADHTLTYSFDTGWEPCAKSEAAYQMIITLHTGPGVKQADLQFQNSRGETLYEQTICFPLLSQREEADS